MNLPRVVAAEHLDRLPANDPEAMRSRRDLQRIHRFMGTVSIVAGALRTTDVSSQAVPLRVLELGAGDGTLMLRVARALGRSDAAVELTLLDRLALIDEKTIVDYAQLGWQARVETVDVLDWARHETAYPAAASGQSRWDLIVANLFLHHFEGSELALLLRAIAARCNRCFACEPRRSRLALIAARLTGLIGANAVTREDAVLSVHAGFRDHELGAQWAAIESGWTVSEGGAGLFSHCFDARRSGAS